MVELTRGSKQDEIACANKIAECVPEDKTRDVPEVPVRMVGTKPFALFS